MNRARRHNAGHYAGICAVGAGLLLVLWAEAAGADTLKPRWEWGMGVAAATLRDYPGSRNYRTYALPFPWFVYRSDRLYLGREGSHGVLWRSIDSELDVSLSLNPSVHQKDNPERAGMPVLDSTLGIGLRERITFWRDENSGLRLSAHLPLRVAYALHHGALAPVGLQFQPGFSLDHNREGAWTWGIGTSISFADNRYNDYFYGVEPVYATPVRPAYTASGGFAGWQLSGRISYHYKHHSVSAFARIEDIEGASFADSPLVSTPYAGTLGLAWSYRIGTSKEMVTGNEP